MHGRTHGRWTTDNGPSQKLTLSTLCSGDLTSYNSFAPRPRNGVLYKDTNAPSINQGFQATLSNVKTDTPIYRNTKFSARKFNNSNN